MPILVKRERINYNIDMRIYNTASRTIEELAPLKAPTVNLYSCGPTVYDFTHIGHMRTYTYVDVLKRSLTYLGYNVTHVMNITDVGHLTGDDDSGEDKLEKGAVKSGKTVWEVAQFYTDFFNKTVIALNILPATTVAKATDHIDDMVTLIKTLEEKGYTYETDEAVYFDVQKFKTYGQLSKQSLDEKKQGVRDEVVADPKKKHPADFSLWFKRVGRFADHTMHWNSPWGEGFPGWHIECSAMSMKYLGPTIDIHTGGIDHIPVHHENEIAQSEAATGQPFVKYWVHFNFLQVDGQKMSKSLGNFYTMEDIEKKGVDPIALRLLFLQAHYRQLMNFTWESVQGAQNSLMKLRETVAALKTQNERTVLSEDKLGKLDEYRQRFAEALGNDLQTPEAVSVMWELVKSNVPSEDKLELLYEFDRVLGLGLQELQSDTIPDDIMELAKKRQQMRIEKRYEETDSLRKEIENKGYSVEDVPDGFRVRKKR